MPACAPNSSQKVSPAHPSDEFLRSRSAWRAIRILHTHRGSVLQPRCKKTDPLPRPPRSAREDKRQWPARFSQAAPGAMLARHTSSASPCSHPRASVPRSCNKPMSTAPRQIQSPAHPARPPRKSHESHRREISWRRQDQKSAIVPPPPGRESDSAKSARNRAPLAACPWLPQRTKYRRTQSQRQRPTDEKAATTPQQQRRESYKSQETNVSRALQGIPEGSAPPAA